MGETREVSRGSWNVYEGDGPPVASCEGHGAINRDFKWPLAFTASRIVHGVWTVVTVEIAEDFAVTHKIESTELRRQAHDG